MRDPRALLDTDPRAARRRARRDRGRDRAAQPRRDGRGRSRRRGRHDLRDRRRRRSDRRRGSPTRWRASSRFVLVAEGLPGGRRVYPAGVDEAVRRLLDHRRSDRRHARPDVPEAQRLDPHRPSRPIAGPATSLRDIELAVQTEIPLVKQHLSRSVVGGARRRRARAALQPADRRTPCRIRLRPSAAASIAHGYATIARFFPGARDELAAIDEAIVRGALGPPRAGQGALLRGSVRLDRRSAVRADGRARPLHRRPAAAAPPACWPAAGCRRRSPAIPTTSAARSSRRRAA